jgi:Holliday junction resolvase RusA-like endonuclease
MSLLEVSIPGDPVGQGRPRVVRHGGRIWAHTPKRSAEWRAGAAWCFKQEWKDQPPRNEPLALHVRAVAARPKRLQTRKSPVARVWRTAKPDGDNVLKAVSDALQDAGVVADDKCIVAATVESLYSAMCGGPCVEVVLEQAGEYTPCAG